jgi:hypothetical protein
MPLIMHIALPTRNLHTRFVTIPEGPNIHGSWVAIGLPCGFASEIHEHRWRPTSSQNIRSVDVLLRPRQRRGGEALNLKGSVGDKEQGRVAYQRSHLIFVPHEDGRTADQLAPQPRCTSERACYPTDRIREHLRSTHPPGAFGHGPTAIKMSVMTHRKTDFPSQAAVVRGIRFK